MYIPFYINVYARMCMHVCILSAYWYILTTVFISLYAYIMYVGRHTYVKKLINLDGTIERNIDRYVSIAR